MEEANELLQQQEDALATERAKYEQLRTQGGAEIERARAEGGAEIERIRAQARAEIEKGLGDMELLRAEGGAHIAELKAEFAEHVEGLNQKIRELEAAGKSDDARDMQAALSNLQRQAQVAGGSGGPGDDPSSSESETSEIGGGGRGGRGFGGRRGGRRGRGRGRRFPRGLRLRGGYDEEMEEILKQLKALREERTPDSGADMAEMIRRQLSNITIRPTTVPSTTTPVIHTQQPALSKATPAIKITQKTVVNEKTRRRKAATRDTKKRRSEYTDLKKRVQARIRKDRAAKYKKESSRISKLPVSQRAAIKKKTRTQYMQKQKALFKTFVGKNKISLAALRKLLSSTIKWN